MRTAEPLEPSSPSSPFFHSCISLRLLPILFFTILPITRLFEFTIRPRRTSRYKFLSPPLHFLFPPLRRPPPSCSSPSLSLHQAFKAPSNRIGQLTVDFSSVARMHERRVKVPVDSFRGRYYYTQVIDITRLPGSHIRF